MLVSPGRSCFYILLLQNAISERFRDGFLMHQADPSSVVAKTYQICLTNETGPRVPQQKIRLFMTEKGTLGSLAEGCDDFDALADTMQKHWEQMNPAEKTASIVSFKDGAVTKAVQSWVPLFPSQKTTRAHPWSPRKMFSGSIFGSIFGGGGETSRFPGGGLVSFKASATETRPPD
jgi:hypothetical protein